MNVTYHATTMREAIEKIKTELGPDAIIVSSKLVRSKKGILGWFSKPIYEVVAEYERAIRSPSPKREVIPQAHSTWQPNWMPADPDEDVPKVSRLPQKTSVSPQQTMPLQRVAPSANPERTTAFRPAVLKTMQEGEGMQKMPQERLNAYRNVQLKQMPEPTPEATTDPVQVASAFISPVVQTVSRSEPTQKCPDHVQIETLDKRITDVQDMLAGFLDKFQYVKREVTSDYDERLNRILMNMIDNEVDPEIAHTIMQKAEITFKTKPDAQAADVVQYHLSQVAIKAKPLAANRFQRKVALFVGSMGAGKTTTLVKLLSQLMLSGDPLKVAIVNLDVYRVGAQEQLQQYAKILDVPMETAYNAQELKEVMEKFKSMDLVFMDTAGRVSGSTEHVAEIRSVLEAIEVDETYLVMAASVSTKAAARILDNYSFLGDYKLILTKLDEATAEGNVINFCARSGRPLAYIANGQSVPDDLHVPDLTAIFARVTQ